jgi:uncharacterized protein (TIGR02145 family)
MRKYFFTLVFLLCTSSFTFAQQYGALKDTRDGKVYKTVKIGTQTWMAENLNTDRFRNGDLIPQIHSEAEWKTYLEAQEPAWCYTNFNSKNGITFGKLYNWYALMDERGLAPKGFHIPEISEWDTLINYLGGAEKAVHKLRTRSGWGKDGKEGGTNSSGFSAFPGWMNPFTDLEMPEFYSSTAGWWSYVITPTDTLSPPHFKLNNLFFYEASIELGNNEFDDSDKYLINRYSSWPPKAERFGEARNFRFIVFHPLCKRLKKGTSFYTDPLCSSSSILHKLA